MNKNCLLIALLLAGGVAVGQTRIAQTVYVGACKDADYERAAAFSAALGEGSITCETSRVVIRDTNGRVVDWEQHSTPPNKRHPHKKPKPDICHDPTGTYGCLPATAKPPCVNDSVGCWQAGKTWGDGDNPNTKGISLSYTYEGLTKPMGLVTPSDITELMEAISPTIDVPPIQEEYVSPGTEFCDMGSCTWIEYDKTSGIWGESMKPHRRTRETCADKTRFLMTSEDGAKHCIKLNK